MRELTGTAKEWLGGVLPHTQLLAGEWLTGGGDHANHAVTVSDRVVACLIRRMNDQQPTLSTELFVQRANHGSIQRGDSIRLVPTVSRDQHQACAVCVAVVHAPVPRATGRKAGGMHRVTHAAVVSA